MQRQRLHYTPLTAQWGASALISAERKWSVGVEQAVERLRKKLETTNREVVFTKHARAQIRSRPTTEAEVARLIREGGESLRYAELQEAGEGGEIYRAHYELSKRHDLAIVFKILKGKVVIITAYRTSRKWQRLALKSR